MNKLFLFYYIFIIWPSQNSKINSLQLAKLFNLIEKLIHQNDSSNNLNESDFILNLLEIRLNDYQQFIVGRKVSIVEALRLKLCETFCVC